MRRSPRRLLAAGVVLSATLALSGSAAAQTAPTPSLSVADASAAEDAGEIAFTVSIDEPASTNVTASMALVPDTADRGGDFRGWWARAVIPFGETSTEVVVALRDDGQKEGDEQFRVEVRNSYGAEVGDGTAVGTIVDDEITGCTNKVLNWRIDRLLDCVDGGDVRTQLETFQAIADANGGTRASGTPGHDASADHVAALLEGVGYTVERQVFDFSLFSENSSSLTADGIDLATQTFSYSASGSVEDGNVIPVDLDLGEGNASTSGCEADDFAGLDFSGDADIALMQRGACAFGDKAVNATDAGAEGAVIFNQGNTPDRTDLIGGTLGEDVVGIVDIPVLDLSYDDGVSLLDASSVSLAADTTITTRTTSNVVADLPGVNPDNVVMAGAHLDSVTEGPGINDNGSGSAALLTVALALGENRDFMPQNTLRFAWWGAEESGLVGSDKYVFDPDFGLTDEEYEDLALYLNFDMVGSPNYVHGVYDADESTFPAPVIVPPGSIALEDLFEAYYSIGDIPYDDSEFSGRSDYQAFIDVGIPASGLFTGAEVVKTAEQQAIWGGTAGESFDPCYHQACDTIDNVNMDAVEVNVDAIAYAVFNLAASTESVNGVEGVEVIGTTPDEVDFDGPRGTFTGGGGLGPMHALSQSGWND